MLTATKPETTSENLTELRARWKEMLPAVQLLAKKAGDLKTLAKKLSTPEGYESLKKLQKDLEKLRSLEMEAETLVAEARTAGESVEGWLALEWSRRGSEFVSDLRGYFQDRSIAVELDGATLMVGSFAIVIQPEKDRAVLRYVDEDVAETPLSGEKIFKAWQSAKDAMEKAHTPPSSLASALLEAHDELSRMQGKAAGSRVRLPDLHFQIFVARQTTQVRQDPRKSKVKDYPRSQFIYDLSVMVERQGLSISLEGRNLIFHPAGKNAGSRANSVKVELEGQVQALGDLEISS